MNRHRDNQNGTTRLRARGTILIVTIWVTMILAGLVLVFARSMRVSAYGAANTIASQQAEMILDGAVRYVTSQVSSGEVDMSQDMTDQYEAMPVKDGYFWVVRPDPESDREVEFGLTDEAGKLNLNTASLEMLEKLPGMTAELAASIVDWRDEDDEITEGGAESEYYLLEANPYTCKNAPLESVEEILLIKGGTQTILYGEDTNHNGMLDDNEDDGDLTDPPDNANGHLEGGLYEYVTVYSMEENVDSEGNARINVNDPQAQARTELQSLLEDTFTDERAAEILTRIAGSQENILAFYFASGMKAEEFAKIADRITTSAEQTMTGLININTAPPEVLQCLPGLEEDDVANMIKVRENTEDSHSMAWIVDALDQEKAVAIGSLITGRSSQYSADIVSVSGNGRAFCRGKVVLDALGSPSKIKYWKSLTDLGWPLDREILTTLKSGQSLEYGLSFPH